MTLRKNPLFAFSILAISAAHAAQPEVDLTGFERDVKPLLETYCVACHGPDRVKAEIRIDTLNPDMFTSDSGEYWEEVYNQLSIGDMPPDDEAQPTVEERETITAWVHHELRRAAELKRSTGGNNVLRRLTAYEYNNTLRDLLGLDLDFAKDLPPEGAAHEGFVNNSAVLGTSGLHLEYFQRIGADALRKALLFGDQPEGFALEFKPIEHLPRSKKDEGELSKKEQKRLKKEPKGPVQVSGTEASGDRVLLPPGNAQIRINTKQILTFTQETGQLSL